MLVYFAVEKALVQFCSTSRDISYIWIEVEGLRASSNHLRQPRNVDSAISNIIQNTVVVEQRIPSTSNGLDVADRTLDIRPRVRTVIPVTHLACECRYQSVICHAVQIWSKREKATCCRIVVNQLQIISVAAENLIRIACHFVEYAIAYGQAIRAPEQKSPSWTACGATRRPGEFVDASVGVTLIQFASAAGQ